jgi:hypothetical protein
VLDWALAPLQLLARLDGLAGRVEDGPGVQVPVLVRVDLVQLRREQGGEVVEHEFERSNIDDAATSG